MRKNRDFDRGTVKFARLAYVELWNDVTLAGSIVASSLQSTCWMLKLPLYPKHPERVCWGCDKYCPADDLACGNGTERTQHPLELFGPDWVEWAEERGRESVS